MRELSPNGATQLRDAAQRAMSMTHSSGAAIALLDVDELVTCASCGDSVPPVGARSPLTGFTGLAIRNGQALVCDDTQADTRVDAAVCRDIKVFSMAVAPIKVGAKIEGAFAIFFSSARAASRMRVAMLRTLADVAGAVLEREPVSIGQSSSAATSSSSVPAPSVSAPAQPTLVAKPHAPAAIAPATVTPGVLKEISDDEIMDALSQIHSDHAGSPSAPRAQQSAARSLSIETPDRHQPESSAKPGHSEPVRRPQESTAPARPVVPPTPKLDAKPAPPAKSNLVAAVAPERPAIVKPKTEVPQVLPAAADPQAAPLPQAQPPARAARQVAETPLFQTVGSERRRSRISRRVLLPAAAIVALVIAVVGFVLYRSPGVNAKAATVPTQPAPDQPQPMPAAPEAVAAVEVEAPALAASAQPPQPAKRVETLPSRKQVAESTAEPVPPRPVMEVRSATGEARRSADEQLVEAPPAIAAPANSSVVLPESRTAVPTAPAAPRTSVFVPASVMQMTKPVYPQMAALRRAQGIVVLQIKISKDGKVIEATRVKGDPMLGQAAIGAVRNWRYKPATRDGVPVDSEGEVSLNFKLPEPR